VSREAQAETNPHIAKAAGTIVGPMRTFALLRAFDRGESPPSPGQAGSGWAAVASDPEPSAFPPPGDIGYRAGTARDENAERT
jgi:hypothetical protein